MSQLFLPAPKHTLEGAKKGFPKQKRSLLAFLALGLAMFVVLIVAASQQKQLIAQLTFNDLQLENSYVLDAVKQAQAVVLDKNLTPVAITLHFRGEEDRQSRRIFTTYQELGFEYSLDERFLDSYQLDSTTPFLQEGSLKGAAESLEKEDAVAQLTVDPKKWDTFIDGLSEQVYEVAEKPTLQWVDGEGWVLREGQKGTKLNERSANRAYDVFLATLEKGELPTAITLVTQADQTNMTLSEQDELTERYATIQHMTVAPLVFQVDGEEYVLDLSSDKEYLQVREGEVTLNEGRIKKWLQTIANEFHRPTNTIRIVDKEEVGYEKYDAIVEGEFVEGRRLDVDEIYTQILGALAIDEKSDAEGEEMVNEETEADEVTARLIHPRSYEIPLRVISEIDGGVEYDLLSVGYSEYSHGNAPNRVHNIKTGLKRVNNALIEPGGKISFNKLSGPIDYEFLTGYAIFGNTAKPSLGGGICQVSTTFYRAMLNLGVPITMRQNHSWDLSYYRKGGYGLDATIFPSVGLDVKAINDYDSHLFFYSYTRPETEEAFVLVYGIDDGREVVLEPHEEYVPFYGAKTLKWTQTISMPDGEVISNEIVSRYRM